MLALLFGLFAVANVARAQPANGACLCITGNSLNIRSTPCGTVIGNVDAGACYTSLGGQQSCQLSGSTYTFWSIQFGSQTGWVANNYVQESSQDDCSVCQIISRSQWGARPPRSTTNLNTPLSKDFVHHSDGAPCFTQSDCSARVRGIQDWHMDGNGWSDIGYNFLVGEDGNAYEGRGWLYQGAHASGWNSQSYGICVMGDFVASPPNQAALSRVQDIIQCGKNLGYITNNAGLYGHRDGVCTSCPGDALYNVIQGWPNFGNPGISGGC